MSHRCGSAGGGVDLQSGAVFAAVVDDAAAADWIAAGGFSCLAACLREKHNRCLENICPEFGYLL